MIDLLESREGDYWVATSKGIARLRPDLGTGTAFDTPWFPVQTVRIATRQSPSCIRTAQAPSGPPPAMVFFAFVLPGNSAGWVLEDMHIPESVHRGDGFSVNAVLDDPSGALWVGASAGLFQFWAEGRVHRSTKIKGLPHIYVQSLLRDSRNRIWVATRGGLCRLSPTEGGKPPGVEQVYDERQGLAYSVISSLAKAPDGSIWAGGARGGVSRLPHDFPDRPLRTFSAPHGLTGEAILSVAVDREGNTWLGTDGSGAMKIARHGFTTYTEADGLANVRIESLFEDRAGALYASAVRNSVRAINRFDGERFTAIYPNVLQERGSVASGWAQIILQDHAGGWWVSTGEGLARFPPMAAPKLASARPSTVYFPPEARQAFRVFEDSRGAIWSSMHGGSNRLGRKDRGAASFTYLPTRLGPAEGLVTAFAEDHSGNIWMGFYGGHELPSPLKPPTATESVVVRYRDAHFTVFGPKDGVPEGLISALFVDHAGRLWIAGEDGGLGRVDTPNDAHPQFAVYNTTRGLGSSSVHCVTEDNWGHIYVGHGHGVDRLDPETGRIRHYTAADGLPLGRLLVALRDRSGDVWFGTTHGLARLEPVADVVRVPPPIVLTGLQIAGVPRRMSQLGETRIAGLQLRPDQRDILVDFVGLTHEAGESLQYEYQLDGDTRGWIRLGDQRRITFANLRSGRYNFSVRAIGIDGLPSLVPASISFEILPPYWLRWWFELLIASLIAALGYTGFRYRVDRLLALERMRTRIATDLHDDIGSSLTQIAILSEVARRGDRQENLCRIADISRELVDSMSDIVWTINPQKDSLDDLVWRMRQFAGEMFVARDIAFTFQAPEGRGMRLGAELRRHVFLVFKECVNNAVRHSACTRASIELIIEHHALRLVIRDNGCGFDLAQQRGGHGLTSMTTRAGKIGGRLEIDTSDRGTVVTLRSPLS